MLCYNNIIKAIVEIIVDNYCYAFRRCITYQSTQAVHAEPPILVGEMSVRTERSSLCDVGEMLHRIGVIAGLL